VPRTRTWWASAATAARCSALLRRGDEIALSTRRSTTSVSALSGGAGVYAWGAHVVPAAACRVAAVRAAAAARSRAAVRARSGGGGGGGVLVARSGKFATHANWRHDTDEARVGSSSDGATVVAHGGTRRAPSPCSSHVLFGAAAGAATHGDAGAPSEAAVAWYDDSGAT
jgi:hypothetical protein